MFAVWSPNGRELFYRTQDQRIMVVSYTAKGDSFLPDKPRLWSETRLADTSFYHIAPDGKRFLVLMPAEPQGQQRPNNQVIFLQNFFDEVRRRVPDGKRCCGPRRGLAGENACGAIHRGSDKKDLRGRKNSEGSGDLSRTI